MIDREHDLPISRQAEALGVSRGGCSKKPQPTEAGDLRIMRRLDELHPRLPVCRQPDAPQTPEPGGRLDQPSAARRA